jgi:uncharacterized beta-barrel protein YwiB (DUF1934 family)
VFPSVSVPVPELELELFKSGTGTFRIHFGTGTGTELFAEIPSGTLELGTFSEEGGTLGTLLVTKFLR